MKLVVKSISEGSIDIDISQLLVNTRYDGQEDISSLEYTKYDYNKGTFFSRGSYANTELTPIYNMGREYPNNLTNMVARLSEGFTLRTLGNVVAYEDIVNRAYNNETTETKYISVVSETLIDDWSLTGDKVKLVDWDKDVWISKKSQLNTSKSINSTIIPNTNPDASNAFSDTSIIDLPLLQNGITNLSNTFSNCTNLVEGTEIISGLVIPNTVTNMSGTFRDSIHLNAYPNLSGLDNLTDASNLFNNTDVTNLSGFNLPTKVTNTANMFRDVTIVTPPSSLDVPRVTNASGMFSFTNYENRKHATDQNYTPTTSLPSLNFNSLVDGSYLFSNNQGLSRIDITLGPQCTNISHMMHTDNPDAFGNAVINITGTRITDASYAFTNSDIVINTSTSSMHNLLKSVTNASHVFDNVRSITGSSEVIDLDNANDLIYAFTNVSNYSGIVNLKLKASSIINLSHAFDTTRFTNASGVKLNITSASINAQYMLANTINPKVNFSSKIKLASSDSLLGLCYGANNPEVFDFDDLTDNAIDGNSMYMNVTNCEYTVRASNLISAVNMYAGSSVREIYELKSRIDYSGAFKNLDVAAGSKGAFIYKVDNNIAKSVINNAFPSTFTNSLTVFVNSDSTSTVENAFSNITGNKRFYPLKLMVEDVFKRYRLFLVNNEYTIRHSNITVGPSLTPHSLRFIGRTPITVDVTKSYNVTNNLYLDGSLVTNNNKISFSSGQTNPIESHTLRTDLINNFVGRTYTNTFSDTIYSFRLVSMNDVLQAAKITIDTGDKYCYKASYGDENQIILRSYLNELKTAFKNIYQTRATSLGMPNDVWQSAVNGLSLTCVWKCGNKYITDSEESIDDKFLVHTDNFDLIAEGQSPMNEFTTLSCTYTYKITFTDIGTNTSASIQSSYEYTFNIMCVDNKLSIYNNNGTESKDYNDNTNLILTDDGELNFTEDQDDELNSN